MGRWLACDPFAAKYPNLSPYNFVDNKPTIAIDPDGKDIIFINGFSYHDMHNDARGGGVDAFRKNNYWNGNNPNFTSNVSKYFNDNKLHFLSASEMKGSKVEISAKQTPQDRFK